ncbi:hypothetical protein BDY17DRAFT_297774 [Neohortaea acidophila]|uniref:Uncharacterized protein n=1 Tax=Neohortaea acidophila TaxID=245834 RepID=A0A6A6PWH3_9PEZI|nr:uncharacterized protein BDY17DRAFT_297774 [Neohortaea acidophila]KAF2483647.1 hypothetical protein BDY17DRAFT_297774 [Neohortaea acidophila]
MPPSPSTWHALIRTHHITSRAKVSKLKQAATKHGVFVLLRSGGAPGMMYVAGEARGNVEEWVGVVQRLRYKDYQLVAKPIEVEATGNATKGLFETDSVADFGRQMEERGVLAWWRKAMGYTS